MPVAGTGAVQILAPQQELDSVITGGDIGLHASGLLQLVGRRQECGGPRAETVGPPQVEMRKRPRG